jgi:hypothetical protein
LTFREKISDVKSRVLRPGLGLGRFGPGRPGLVSGLTSIKLKNLNYYFLSIFGVIETKFRALLSIIDTFYHLSGFLDLI